MTVLACKIEQDGIYLSADSQVTQNSLATYNIDKIFEYNNVVYGFCGKYSVAQQIMEYIKNIKIRLLNRKDIIILIQKIKKHLQYNNDETWENFGIIIIAHNKAYTCYADGCVEEIQKYNALGSGRDLALACLYNNGTTEQAVNTAKYYNIYCGGETKTVFKKFS